MSNDAMRGAFAADIIGDVPEPAWHDVLYERTICGIAGPSGIGKSFSVRRIVADWSRTRGGVIYGNLEDDRIMQRFSLEAAGADMSKVRLASYRINHDLEELEYDVDLQKVSLIVFDTAAKHLPNLSMNRWDGPLAELHEVAQRTGATVILVHHTNKGVKAKDDWRASIGGATAGFMGTCRVIALVGKRPDNPEQLVVKQVKNSYAPEIDALAFEWGTEDLVQKNGNMIEMSYLTLVEKDIKITNPTALVCLKGDADDAKGPSPERRAEAAEFLQECLAQGAAPVNDVYVCADNPNGIMPDGSPTDHMTEGSWVGRKCGTMALKMVEANTPSNGTHVCPHCGGAVKGRPGLKSLAEVRMISNGTIKRAKAALEIDTDCKGFAAERVQYWTLPDDHPSLDENAPGNERVALYDAVGNPELDENGVQIMVLRSKPIA